MYATYRDSHPKRHYSYYVDDLRKKFTIRVEIDRTNLCYGYGYSDVMNAHVNMHKDLVLYLSTRLHDTEWEIQQNNGYYGFHYIWFTNKEDALATLLKFGGKIV